MLVAGPFGTAENTRLLSDEFVVGVKDKRYGDSGGGLKLRDRFGSSDSHRFGKRLSNRIGIYEPRLRHIAVEPDSHRARAGRPIKLRPCVSASCLPPFARPDRPFSPLCAFRPSPRALS
jgi:hypothetical protein